MKRKAVMKLCAVAMTVAMMGSLVACGNDSGSNSNSSTPEESKSEETPEEGGEEADAGETYDFGGQVVKVNGNLWDNLKEGSDKYEVYWDMAHQIEEKYNIKFEYVELVGDDGYSAADKILQTITNGECYADIFAASDDTFVKLIGGDGYLADITDTVDELQVGSLWTQGATWQGHIYGLTFDEIGSSYVMVYSRDYLTDVLGMTETPTDRFMAGKWSYDDCIEYLTEMKSKLPDGTYPMSLHYYHWASMAPAANGGVVSVDSEGNIGLTDEKYIEAMEFYVKLQEQGLAQMMVPKDNGDGTYSSSFEYGMDNMSTATEGKSYVMTMAEAWQMGDLLDKVGNWGVVPWPWGSSVTCDGDYTTLSDNYLVPQSIWTDVVVPKAEYRNASSIPDIDLFKIACDFYFADSVNKEKVMHEAWEAEQAGSDYGYMGWSAGSSRHFCTEDDIAVYDWLHTHAGYDWGHAFDEVGVTNVWENAKRIVAVKLDARSVAESYAQEAEANMKDMGLK